MATGEFLDRRATWLEDWTGPPLGNLDPESGLGDPCSSLLRDHDRGRNCAGVKRRLPREFLAPPFASDLGVVRLIGGVGALATRQGPTHGIPLWLLPWARPGAQLVPDCRLLPAPLGCKAGRHVAALRLQ